MNISRFISVLLSSLLLLTTLGCVDKSKEYQEGFKAGTEVAAAESYARGHSDGYRTGFLHARPGSSSELSGASLVFYKVLIWAGAIKVVGSFLVAAFYMFKASDSWPQTAGKILFSVIGAIAGVAAIIYTQASSDVVDFILLPAPKSIFFRGSFLLFLQLVLLGYFLFSKP